MPTVELMLEMIYLGKRFGKLHIHENGIDLIAAELIASARSIMYCSNLSRGT